MKRGIIYMITVMTTILLLVGCDGEHENAVIVCW